MHGILSKQQQFDALQTFEERQYGAEIELEQDQQRQAVEAKGALRHMEAACANTERNITKENLELLDQQRRKVAKLDKKHSSEITVLRGKQERTLGAKRAKQKKELEDLIEQQQRQIGEEEDGATLRRVTEKRRIELKERSLMRLEDWRRNYEHEYGIDLSGKHTPWSPAFLEADFVDLPPAQFDSVLDHTAELLKASSRKPISRASMSSAAPEEGPKLDQAMIEAVSRFSDDTLGTEDSNSSPVVRSHWSADSNESI